MPARSPPRARRATTESCRRWRAWSGHIDGYGESLEGKGTSHLRAYGYVAGAAAIWGCLGVMAKSLYAEGMSPWTLVFYRSFLGVLACGAVMLAVNRDWFRVSGRDLPFLAVYGLISTSAFFALYLYTISLTTVAVAVVLLYTSPVFSAILGRLVYGEALTTTKILALGFAFAGCVMVTGLETGQLAVSALGIATGLGSAVTYASFGIMGKHARRRYNPMTILFYSMGFATLFLLPVLALPEAGLGPFSARAWVILVLVAVGPTLLARVLFVTAVKHVEASRAAIVATVEPVVATVLAALLLGELLAPSQVVGGLLVIGGSVLAQQAGFLRGRPAASGARQRDG